MSKDSSGNRIACPPPTEGSGYALVNANSFEVLSHLPAGSIDLIILDPPSGAYHTSHGGEHWAWDVRWTKEEWERLLPEVWRVLAVGARLIIFGCASEKLVADINEYVTSNAPNGGVAKSLCSWIHNDPTSGVQNSHDPARMTEEIFVFRRAKETIATATLGNNSGRAKPTELFYEYKDDEKLDVGSRNKMRMKPINLIRALIRGFERSGTDRSGKVTSESGKGVVLDLTMNTGGSGRGALLEGRRFVGVERFSSFAKACEQMKLQASVVAASLPSQAGSSSRSGDALVATNGSKVDLSKENTTGSPDPTAKAVPQPSSVTTGSGSAACSKPYNGSPPYPMSSTGSAATNGSTLASGVLMPEGFTVKPGECGGNGLWATRDIPVGAVYSVHFTEREVIAAGDDPEETLRPWRDKEYYEFVVGCYTKCQGRVLGGMSWDALANKLVPVAQLDDKTANVMLDGEWETISLNRDELDRHNVRRRTPKDGTGERAPPVHRPIYAPLRCSLTLCM